MKNTAKKISAILITMVALITALFMAKPAEVMANSEKTNIGTAIRYENMKDGLQLIHLMGDHDEVVAELAKFKESLEKGTLQSAFLISSLEDIRNTEVHIFVNPKKVDSFFERLQYEGSPELVKQKRDELKSNGYVIEGYVEFSGDIVPVWSKVIAIKHSKY